MRFRTIVLAGALSIAAVFAGGSRLIAQQPSCLHGPNESDAERARKRQALTMARQINTLENAAFQAQGTYPPLRELARLNSPPQGFEVHAAIDAQNYLFSIKDITDPCGFAYFSDRSGLIYAGEVIR